MWSVVTTFRVLVVEVTLPVVRVSYPIRLPQIPLVADIARVIFARPPPVVFS